MLLIKLAAAYLDRCTPEPLPCKVQYEVHVCMVRATSRAKSRDGSDRLDLPKQRQSSELLEPAGHPRDVLISMCRKPASDLQDRTGRYPRIALQWVRVPNEVEILM